jgi:MFS family permease
MMAPSLEWGELARRRAIQQVSFASFLGTTLESYDFFLYGIATALVFPRLFFPRFSPLASTLASFATFSVAFFARPFGGVVLGHLGDRVGRRTLLVMTLLLMGSATFLIGLLPTFDQIGVMAPITLVVLRITQGFAAGGEWGGATLMAFEHAPEGQRNFYASWPQLGVPAGLLLSTAIFSASSSLPERQFLAWGWRLGFLLSVALIALGLAVRLRLQESPAFAHIKSLAAEAKTPMREVLREQHITVILGVGVVFVSISSFYIVTTFSLSYLTQQLGVPRSLALTGAIFFSVVEITGILIFARIADLAGRSRMAICIAWCHVLFAYPYFWLLSTRETGLIWLAMAISGLFQGALYGITGAFLAELFEARVRCSGISLAYQVGGLLAGAPAPILSTFLIHWSQGNPWPVATYLIASSLITLVAIYAALYRQRVTFHSS